MSEQDNRNEVADAESGADEEASHAEASKSVATEDESHGYDERSMATAPDQYDDDDDDDDVVDQHHDKEDAKGGGDEGRHSKLETSGSKAVGPGTSNKKKKGVIPPSARKGRSPAVKGLTIPFRTVKKAMKLDPDIPIVQNEAAIMTTMASELFLKSLAKESQQIAKNRGRNTIRYEDVAEARSNDAALSFLQTLLP